MEKYLYNNIHFFTTMDPKRTIKMSSKVLYAGLGPTACHSMTYFTFATHCCDRKTPWETSFTYDNETKKLLYYKPLNLNIHHTLKS